MRNTEVSTQRDDGEERVAAPVDARAHPRYELLDEIGRGGMGVVLRARDRELDREVALKLLLDEHAAALVRFDLEAHVTARLQHPAIVPIYDTGRLRNGTPYYAMRLVAGESLTRRIAACTNLDDRLELVSTVLVIAEASAYAHAHGVIHRDLKPDNVLVGEFGETMVLDWGIAKQSAALHDTADGAEPSERPGLTSAGAIIGTPAYMPPEQAAGQAVDARADVYAIGAILYHLLSGEPPYHGAPSEVVAKLVLAPPPALSAELPQDLRAIVETAMARDVTRRYASARELAADLRRLIAGQLVAAHRYTLLERAARFARRHRGAVATGAVFVALGVAGGGLAIRSIVRERDSAEFARAQAELERSAADAVRTDAQRGRDAAEELVAFVLDDLQGKLARVGQLALLESAGDGVERYYAAVSPTEGEERPTLRRVQALVLLGRAQLTRGAGNPATATLESAVTAARSLQSSIGLADALRWYAVALRDVGRGDDSTEILKEARSRADVSGQTMLRARTRIELARNYLQVSDVEAAHPETTTALALARALVAVEPDNAENQELLTLAIVTTATVRSLLGESLAAVKMLAEHELTLAMRVEADPADARLQSAMAYSRRTHARLEARLRHYDVARELATDALERSERLAASDPANLDWQRVLAESLEVYAVIQGATGNTTEAVSGYERMAEISRRIVAADPGNVDAILRLSKAEARCGTAHYIRTRYLEADAAFARAERTIAPVVEGRPDSDAAAHLVRTRLWHCEALYSLDRVDETMALARLALADAQGMHDRNPTHGEHAQRLARALTMVALAAGETAERRDFAARAVALLEQLARRGQMRNDEDMRLLETARSFAEKER